MDLVELQRELRAVGKKIAELESAIEGMKPKKAKEENYDYKAIENYAAKYPLDRGLDEKSGDTKDMYMKLLTGIALMNEEHMREKLTYISRIAAGIDSRKYTLKWNIKEGLKMDEDDMDNIEMCLYSVDYPFLVDSFVVSNICGKADEKVFQALGELSAVLGCSADDVKLIAAAAKGVLMNDFSYFSTISDTLSYSQYEKLRCFIPWAREWLEEHKEDYRQNGLFSASFRNTAKFFTNTIENVGDKYEVFDDSEEDDEEYDFFESDMDKFYSGKTPNSVSEAIHFLRFMTKKEKNELFQEDKKFDDFLRNLDENERYEFYEAFLKSDL